MDSGPSTGRDSTRDEIECSWERKFPKASSSVLRLDANRLRRMNQVHALVKSFHVANPSRLREGVCGGHGVSASLRNCFAAVGLWSLPFRH